MQTQTVRAINRRRQHYTPRKAMLVNAETSSMKTNRAKKPSTKGRRGRAFNLPLKHNRHHQSIDALKAHRKRLSEIAQDTLQTVLITKGYHEDIADTDLTTGSCRYHDLSSQIQRSRDESSFYPHYSPLLAGWKEGPSLQAPEERTEPSEMAQSSTTFEFTKSSPLSAARRIWSSNKELQMGITKIGILNSATPKKPGGSSLSGGDTQEECLVRQTTVFDSLQNSLAGEQFYLTHRRETDGSGLHDHAMLYSPNVIAFKTERGKRVAPITINIVSSVPVNAATVRSKHNVDPSELTEGIRTVMTERMARILRLFEERGDRVLVLNAFGAGQFCNSPEMIGEIWADLLHVRGAKFEGAFDTVIFAVPGKHLPAFECAFSGRCLEAELSDSLDELDVVN